MHSTRKKQSGETSTLQVPSLTASNGGLPFPEFDKTPSLEALIPDPLKIETGLFKGDTDK